jgi:hypothetical protein
MFAAWGIDYIKIDGMTDSNAADVKSWSDAIRHSGRSMVLDVTQGDFTMALRPDIGEVSQSMRIRAQRRMLSLRKRPQPLSADRVGF